jgi:hypothetical protein
MQISLRPVVGSGKRPVHCSDDCGSRGSWERKNSWGTPPSPHLSLISKFVQTEKIYSLSLAGEGQGEGETRALTLTRAASAASLAEGSYHK